MKTIFRFWIDQIIALFPEVPGSVDVNFCSAYSIRDGYFSIDPNKVMTGGSKPATIDQYLDTAINLIRRGVELDIVFRFTKSDVSARSERLGKLSATEPTEVRLLSLPATWAKYLITGDPNTIPPDEKIQADAFKESEGLMDATIFLGEPRFADTNPATEKPGDVLDFIFFTGGSTIPDTAAVIEPTPIAVDPIADPVPVLAKI